MAGVLRDLGLRQAGGNNSHLRRVVKKFGISTKHFKGSAANCGPNHKPKRKLPEQILILRREFDPRTHGKRLRQALIDLGRLD